MQSTVRVSAWMQLTDCRTPDFYYQGTAFCRVLRQIDFRLAMSGQQRYVYTFLRWSVAAYAVKLQMLVSCCNLIALVNDKAQLHVRESR